MPCYELAQSFGCILPIASLISFSFLDHGPLRCIVDCVQVNAMLVELRMEEVAGFDLSVMDAYRWHPHAERVELDRCAA